MKVMFICSFSGKELYQEYYDLIVHSIESRGATLTSAEKREEYEKLFTEENLEKFGGRKQIHDHFIQEGIEQADVVIVENTHPSFKVGYEVHLALQRNKPVLCLSLDNDEEMLIRDPLFTGKKYTKESVKEIIDQFLSSTKRSLAIADVFPEISTNQGANKQLVGIIGAINLDITAYVERLPPITNSFCPSVSTIGERNTLGGKGANVAVALSNLGLGSYIISKVGNDPFGKQCLSLLAQRHVSLDYTAVDRFSSTGCVITFIDKQNQIQTVVHEGVNSKLEVEKIKKFLSDNKADLLYLTLEPQHEIVEYVIRTAQERDIPLFVNLSPVTSQFHTDYYSNIEFVCMDKEEATNLTGQTVTDPASAEKAAHTIRDLGGQNIIITLREKGAIILPKGKETIQYYKAKFVKTINQIGAGDAFAAGFITSYLQVGDIDMAMQFANIVGAYAVTRLGDYESMPTFDDLRSIGFIESSDA